MLEKCSNAAYHVRRGIAVAHDVLGGESGFVNVGNEDLPEGSRFLPKPYLPEQVVATLRELTFAA